MILGLTLADDIQLWVALIGAVGAAVAACIAAWKTGQVHQAIKPPSNSVSIGALAENQSINLSTLVHLVAENLGKDVSVPTAKQTANGDPGATLSSPPAKPTDTPIAPPLPEGPQP